MSLKKQLLSGVAYTAVAKYMGVIVSLVVTGVLARLLAPSDFGIVAIATVIITFFNVFSDLGIAPAIIQSQTLTKRDLSNIFSFTFWFGILVSLLFFLLAPLIASYYENEKLITICRILSINLCFASLNIVPNALLFKNKLFKYIAIRNFVIQLFGGTVAVIMANRGIGLYALLINPIFSSIMIFIVGYIKYPQKLRFTLGITSIKKIFSFSVFQFLFNVINFFTRNLDKLMIGKYLSTNLLGYYEKSYRLMMLPLENITFVLNPVMLPIFSEYQNDLANLANSYLKVIKTLCFIGFPLALLLHFASEEIILLVFGMQWERSVPVFSILALSVGFQVVMSTSGSIFQAAGSTKILFFNGIISTILNITALLIGIFVYKSMETVALGILISFIVNFFITYYLMYTFTFKNKKGYLVFLKQLISPLCLSVIIAIILFLITKYIDVSYFTSKNANLICSLVFKSLVVTLLMIFYLEITKEYAILKKLVHYFNKIKKR